MLKTYSIRFYDDKDHQKGIISTVTAIDQGQAIVFADMIAKELDCKWKSYVEWVFVKTQ